MVELDLICCIFDEYESKEFQKILEIVDELADPDPNKALS